MRDIKIKSINDISKNFIPKEYLIEDNDDYFRQKQNPLDNYRKLQAKEIEILVKNNNFSEDWNAIFVTDNFNPNLVKNCDFFGLIRIGDMSLSYLEHHDLRLPIGISNSTIICCDIGNNAVIRDVHYLSHYIIRDNCILFNIQEMSTTNYSKFGNGILKEGEDEQVRIWLEVGNENAGRKIFPFENMITADAFIWSKFRDDKKLMEKLISITERNYSKKRGYFGEVGSFSVMKNCRIIKDVKFGEYSYAKGANKLKNLTVLSSKDEPSQIGEGVEIVNGIIGYGSKIFYGCKAVRFVTGRNTQLKYGARLLNSVLGDNSTISCCELLNNLIFPFHEQHHNTSFLIATTILGQSNIAAGATIGSNHNSRSPDGEIFAGRGFWPGLCTSFKHNSKFASFILVAKGDYSYEMNILYPFSLIYLKKDSESVQIMPAYWFIHNMYAIARNNYKFKSRDKRKVIVQNIEIDFLAPDSISEILFALKRMEYLAGLKPNCQQKDENLLINEGKKILKTNKDDITLFDPHSMKKYGGVINKPARAYEIYKKMCIYFAVKNFYTYFNLKDINLNNLIEKLKEIYKEKLYLKWWNVGGQLIPYEELENLKNDIKDEKLTNWDEVHSRYNELWASYPTQKLRYALYVLETILEKEFKDFTDADWNFIFTDAIDTAKFIQEVSFDSRLKDYTDPFRKMNYENEEEMKAVLGDIKDNDFLITLQKETKEFVEILGKFGGIPSMY
ncbi:MAG: hypothetical protein A2Y34_11865 [Spirochaetes bacterium GWC1_27_15]|nr:MAG: hypothetical protein A2Z98_13445 [Spirochaetes bacterium GWB1_27_13]OHD20924.1 MAG: hypothetical protein A2Y34_11865 [Spirochaetes bacterium GWC1_27_15]